MTGDADEIQRQSRILRKQGEELDAVIHHCQIFIPARAADYAGIGVIVDIQRYCVVTRDKINGIETYEIGGYRSTDLKTTPPTLSYDSPVAASLRGLQVGDESPEVTIAGKCQYFKILALRLPGEKTEPATTKKAA
jgi:transcription elongation GreA/GreB family factor